MSDQSESDVYLYVYDMSNGMAKALSPAFIGKEVNGIWHTAIVVYGREYFFGGGGIDNCRIGGTLLGQPHQIIPLGITHIPYSLFQEYLNSLGEEEYCPSSYNLLEHNCNNFSNELALFLTGKEIPSDILNLPKEFLSTPLGQTFKGLLNSFTVTPQPLHNHVDSAQLDYQQHNNPAPQIVQADCKMSETEQAKTQDVEKDEEDDGGSTTEKTTTSSLAPRKSYKYDDPPIVFKEIDGIAALSKVEEMVINLLNPQQQMFLKEIGEYLESDSGAWAIGDEHLDLIVYLLNGGEGKFAPNVTLLTLEILQAAALKEDVVLILHQDRKDHRLMSYINKIENLTLAEQEEIVKLLCNLCGQPSTFDWLLYISEWTESDGQSSSNSRVVVRAAVHTLLNEQLTTLQRNGVFLIYNLSLKDVFEDIAIELSTAVLQYLHSDVPDDQALLCLTVISRFMAISMTDVPALIKMLGPDFAKYKGKNEEMDKLVEEIEYKVSRLPSFS